MIKKFIILFILLLVLFLLAKPMVFFAFSLVKFLTGLLILGLFLYGILVILPKIAAHFNKRAR